MRQMIFTTDNNLASLLLRVTLGGIVFIHGLDKIGPGFDYFMDFVTNGMGVPAILGWATVFIETVCCISLIVGFATRINALLLFGLFVGIIIMVHARFGFQMNWAGQLEAGQEGYEYHLLVLAICAALAISGGGRLSIDRTILEKLQNS